VSLQGMGERGVIEIAQIAAEPDEGGRVAGHGFRWLQAGTGRGQTG
jgi:hypothetical protein